MNTRNIDGKSRRLLVIFMLTLVFNISGAHAEDLETRDTHDTEVKTCVEESIDSIKETEKWKQRQAEERQKEKERKAKIEAKKREEAHWKSLGPCRVTTYCPACNDPAGSYQSSSGITLYEGVVACRWLQNGTKLRIWGNEYVVMDTCGTDAIDIFVDTSCCQCNTNCYTEVEIWR